MLKIEELETKLKNEDLAGIYLFFGEENFLIDSNLKKIKKTFGELIKGINYILIDEETITNIIKDIETPAFGYEKKLIIARDTGLLKKDGKKKNIRISELRDRLNDYIQEKIDLINQSVVIVFIEKDVDSRLKLFKTLDKNGIACKFDFQKPLQIEKRLKAICNAYNVKIDSDTLKYFIETCGINMQDLINEIRKIIEYVGKDGTIQKKDVDKLCIRQIESVIFDLTDSLGKRDVEKALQTLNNLIYTKEPIQKILITLYNHFRKLYLSKLSIKYDKDLSETLNLKPNQMFLINKYKAQAKYFEEKELKNIIDKLIDLDYKYKIGLIDVNIGLESIICAYCS